MGGEVMLIPTVYRYHPSLHPFNIVVIFRVALDFCARKISQYSGDIRRGFHICRRALEIRGNESRTVQVSRGSQSTLLS